MSDNLGTAVLKLTTDPTAFIRGMKDAYSRARRFNTQLTSVAASARRIGSSMTRMITLPLLALGTASTKMGMDFEASMSKIVGLVGVAQSQVDQWSADILKTASSFSKAPQEMADAMFFITSAGLRGERAFEALQFSAKGSAGGLGEM